MGLCRHTYSNHLGVYKHAYSNHLGAYKHTYSPPSSARKAGSIIWNPWKKQAKVLIPDFLAAYGQLQNTRTGHEFLRLQTILPSTALVREQIENTIN